MLIDIVGAHIERTEDTFGGKPRIAGHRIRVQDVAIWHEEAGWSVDKILEEYPTITRADVYAALAYYWDHRAEIDSAIRAERMWADEMRAKQTGRIAEILARHSNE